MAKPRPRGLEAGNPVLGLTVTTSNLEVAALGATLGFDFLWVEMEHSPITLETLRNMVLTTRGLPASIFARVPVVELWAAKRVLHQGVSGVIFPFASTPELAERAAQACKYPPMGQRGCGPGLAQTSWPEPDCYHDSADRNVMVVTVIEEARVVERIDEIASTPGVDVLFIGTADLSFSLGLRGRQDEPALNEAIAKVAAAAKGHGKYLGRPERTAEQVRQFHELGFQFLQCMTELGLMTAGAKALLEPLGIRPFSQEKRALY